MFTFSGYRTNWSKKKFQCKLYPDPMSLFSNIAIYGSDVSKNIEFVHKYKENTKGRQSSFTYSNGYYIISCCLYEHSNTYIQCQMEESTLHKSLSVHDTEQSDDRNLDDNIIPTISSEPSNSYELISGYSRRQHEPSNDYERLNGSQNTNIASSDDTRPAKYEIPSVYVTSGDVYYSYENERISNVV